MTPPERPEVAPFSPEEEAAVRRSMSAEWGMPLRPQSFKDMTARLLATIDAERRRPAAAEPLRGALDDLAKAVERLKYWTDGHRRQCWCPPDWDHGFHTDQCLVVTEAMKAAAALEATAPSGARPCPISSAITGAPCVLPEGHEPDSPERFHRYAQRSSDA